ncbi:MAG: FHA domain-containing protein, partial [Pyrinomonadaceae bacterium]
MESEHLANPATGPLRETETVVTATVNPQNGNPEKLELRFDLQKQRLRVGRDPQNEIFIQKTDVSRFHASLLLRPEGRLLIADLNSRNGTSLNGTRLENGQAYEVNDNDLVKFGDTEVRFNWAQIKPPENLAERETSLVFPSPSQEADALPSSVLDETQPPPAHESLSEKLVTAKEEKKPEKASVSVARSAGIVSIAVMGSRVLGLVRE